MISEEGVGMLVMNKSKLFFKMSKETSYNEKTYIGRCTKERRK